MNQDPTQQNPVGDTTPPRKKGINLVAAIAIAVVIAMILAGTSLQLFLSSNTREIISLTEEASENSAKDALSEEPDDTSSLTTDDLSDTELDIINSADSVDSDEFGSSEVTDAALGL